MSQDKSDRMSEDMFARSSERMCQKEWSKICQECQKILICLKEVQRECLGKDIRNMFKNMSAKMSASHTQNRKLQKKLEMDFFMHGNVVGMYWENIARSMVERAHRDAWQLDVPLFCLQAADQRHARKNKTIDKQLTHQLLTVPNPHRTGNYKACCWCTKI